MSTQLQVMKDKLAKMRAEKKNAVAVNSSVLFWGG